MNALALALSPSQWLVLVVVCLLLFGGRLLPWVARILRRLCRGCQRKKPELPDKAVPRRPYPDAIDVEEVETQRAGEEHR